MFQVLIDSSSREVIGVGPFDSGTDPGAGYNIVEVGDDSQQEQLNVLSPAYLSRDGTTIQGTQP